MDPILRKELKERVLNNSSQYGLDNMMVQTYLLQLDQKTQITAIDMVHSLASLLESPRNLTQKEHSSFEERKHENSNLLQQRITNTSLNQNQLALKTLEQEKHIDYLTQCKYDNFYVALDALEKKNKPLLEKGIDLAKEVQQAIIQIGTQILEKK